jgi:hypothetical protein
MTYGNGKACGHSVKVVWVLTHSHDLGNDGISCPVNPKDFGKFLQVLCSSFSYREDRVT